MFNKLEKYLFYFFLFSIPFQTRKILWYEGWRFNEWQSVSIYFTDALLLALLLLWCFNSYSRLSNYELRITNYKKNIITLILNTKYLIQKSDFYLAAFLIVSALSITNSTNPIVSWFQWLKLVEFAIFYWYLSNYAFAKFGLYNSFLAVFVGGIFQSVVAIIQFLKQSSVGLRFLGESIINSDLSGIASFYLPDGEKVIRAYGTTPHPNVLAVYLLSVLCIMYYVLWKKSETHTTYYLLLTTYSLVLFAFLTTFSRTVIFIWFVFFCLGAIIIRLTKRYRLNLGAKEGRKRIKTILLVSLCLLVIFSSFYFNEIKARLTISGEDQAVELRAFYASESLKTGFNLFGVGIGNFVGWMVENNPHLPSYTYQPVHNIYLLIYSETGILGILFFVAFLIYVIKHFVSKTRLQKSYHLSFLVFFCSLLFIGFFDHLFLTLQQGSLVFWGGLGLLTYLSKGDIV
ncbi:MAG: O-antigen ligase family protein [bacterium]|nr:O-antigen ligase family protein [bacterium]